LKNTSTAVQTNMLTYSYNSQISEMSENLGAGLSIGYTTVWSGIHWYTRVYTTKDIPLRYTRVYTTKDNGTMSLFQDHYARAYTGPYLAR